MITGRAGTKLKITMETNNITLSATFAAFVKDKRLAMGLTQEELAMRIYGNKEERARISRIENGKKDISVKTMDFVLKALNSWVQFVE